MKLRNSQPKIALRHEIIFILIIKLILLSILWYECFSHPINTHTSQSLIRQKLFPNHYSSLSEGHYATYT